MATWASLQAQMASLMEVLTKTALLEMTKLVDDASGEFRLEISRSQRENEALKSKLLVMEGELRAAHARGCGEGTSDSSLNIALEVKVCDQFREAQTSKITGKGNVVAVERVFDERLGTYPVGDEQDVPVEKKEAVPGALDMKYEPAVSDQDWSESVLFTGDWLELDIQTSQSQKIIKETCYGPLGAVATADNGGEGPLCYKEELHMQPCTVGDAEKWLRAELKQEPDGESVEAESTPGEAAAKGGEGPLREEEEQQHMLPCPVGDPEMGLHVEMEQEGEPLNPGHPLPGSAGGLKVQCARSKSTRSGKVQEMVRYYGGSSEHGGAWSNDQVSPRNFRASRRLHSEKNKGPASHLEQQQNGSPHSILEKHQFWDKTFPQCHALQAHQRVHTREKPFVCTQCGKSFSLNSSLKTHQITHTREKWLCCTVCNKSFPRLQALKRHQSVHTGEKPYSCNECGKSFTQLCSLKTHQKVHTGEKPYSCDQCGKNFAHLYDLKIHQRLHTRERPFGCDECGRSFVTKGNLKIHQRLHTGEKPFGCDECGKNFTTKGNLKSHQRVHVREKPAMHLGLQKHMLTHS